MMSTNSVDIEYLSDDPKVQKQALHSDTDDDSTCGSGCLAGIMFFISILLIILTFPISLIFCVKVVQEYERAVIFRLGRVRRNGTVGPGMFFIVPCLDQVKNYAVGISILPLAFVLLA